MKRTNRLTEGNILHTLIRFAVPVFFTLFLQALYGGVDLLVVGQFAATADVSGVATGSMLVELNQVDAVAFQPLNTTAEEYAALRQLLLQQLCQMTPYVPGPGCREQLTGAGALLTSGFPGRTVSLTVGSLVLNNVEMLGFVGDMLLLGSPTAFRFYLVRADQITFLQ